MMTSKGISAPPDWTFHTTQQPLAQAASHSATKYHKPKGYAKSVSGSYLEDAVISVQGYANWLATRTNVCLSFEKPAVS